MKKNDRIKIIMKSNRIITRKDLFEKKEEFHKEQANLPFEEKIKILVKLQKIANNAKAITGGKKCKVWEI